MAEREKKKLEQVSQKTQDAITRAGYKDAAQAMGNAQWGDMSLDAIGYKSKYDDLANDAEFRKWRRGVRDYTDADNARSKALMNWGREKYAKEKGLDRNSPDFRRQTYPMLQEQWYKDMDEGSTRRMNDRLVEQWASSLGKTPDQIREERKAKAAPQKPAQTTKQAEPQVKEAAQQTPVKTQPAAQTAPAKAEQKPATTQPVAAKEPEQKPTPVTTSEPAPQKPVEQQTSAPSVKPEDADALDRKERMNRILQGIADENARQDEELKRAGVIKEQPAEIEPAVAVAEAKTPVDKRTQDWLARRTQDFNKEHTAETKAANETKADAPADEAKPQTNAVPTPATPSPAPAPSPSVAEQRQAALDKAIEKVTLDANNAPDLTTQAGIQRQNLTDEQKSALGVQNAIHNAYSPTITNMGNMISELETARKNAKAQDATEQRRARNMQTIAGISDSLASLANLIGVGQGGTNIDMGTGALTPLQQKAEAARLERKADIKSIDERLEQYRRQLDQMKMQKGAALAAYEQRKEEKASDRAYDAAKTKDAQAFQAKLLGLQQAHAASEAAKGRAHESAENEKRITAQKEISQGEIQARKDIATANNNADVIKHTIRYGSNAEKGKTPFVMDDPTTGERRLINISDKSLQNILDTYLPNAVKNGEISEDEAEEVKEFSKNANSKSALLGLVNKSKTLQEALLFAVGQETGTGTGTGTKNPAGNALWGQQPQAEPGWATKYNAEQQ